MGLNQHYSNDVTEGAIHYGQKSFLERDSFRNYLVVNGPLRCYIKRFPNYTFILNIFASLTFLVVGSTKSLRKLKIMANDGLDTDLK